MIPLKITELLRCLREWNYTPELQEGQNQLVFTQALPELQLPVFIRVNEQEELAHIIAFIPYTMRSESFASISRLLHMLNKEVDLPGFCLDEAHSVVFYRFVCTAPGKEIHPGLLKKMIIVIPRLVALFYPVISACSQGVSFADCITKAKQVLNQVASQQQK